MLLSSPYPKLIDVRAVEILHDFTVRVTFSDESQREIDLTPYLWGPIFEPIRTDPAFFRQVTIDQGALAWPNGADIDTDTLYYDGPPPWAQEQAKPRRKSKKTARSRVIKRPRAARAKSQARVR